MEKNLPPKEEIIIEVPLMAMQKQYYKAILEKNGAFLSRGFSGKGAGPSLMNVAMELRKCCNHPYLITGAEDALCDGIDPTDNPLVFRRLIEVSGKVVLLDKLLPRLRERGPRRGGCVCLCVCVCGVAGGAGGWRGGTRALCFAFEERQAAA